MATPHLQTARRIMPAFLALLGIHRALDAVCEAEFQEWIHENEHRTRLPLDKLAKHRDEARASTVAIMRNLRRNLATSFGVIFSACIAGLGVASIAGSPAKNSPNAVLGLVSAALFAWATLAKLEWLQGSYGGATIFEALDRLIFRLLYWLGMILATLSFLVS